MIEKINLNFDWKYNEEFSQEALDASFDDSNFKSVNIPHTNKEVPYNDFNEEIYQFVSVYRKHVYIDPVLLGKRLILEFEAVANAADVYVNGKLAFSHKGSYTAFSGDITDYIQVGKDNVIAVKVDSTEREDIPPFGNIVDYLVYGGIYREAYLIETGYNYIQNPFFYATDLLNENKMWHLKCSFKHTKSGKIGLLVIDNKETIIDKIFE